MRLIFWTLKIVLVTINFSWCQGQCNGPPSLVLPNNSTGSLAFPEANLDPMTGIWSNQQFYPVGVTCSWVLKAPPQHVLYLKILFLKTEEKFDVVTLYGSEDRKDELFKFSGDLNEVWEGVTPDNTLVVDFISDAFTTFYGFHFAFMYLPKACVTGGVILQEPQLIALPPWNLQGILPGPQRPGFEAPTRGVGIHLREEESLDPPPAPRWVNVSPYPQGLNCTWHLRVEKLQLLKVDVLQFQTDADDILQVWKIDGSELRPLLKYWDDQIPRKEIMSSSPLLLNFGSRISERGLNSGFLLNVSYITRTCKVIPEHLVTPQGLIAYPEHNVRSLEWQHEEAVTYGPDSCRWVLEAPPGYTFNLSLLFLDTNQEDKVTIMDGDDELFNEGGTLQEVKRFSSEGNLLVISFSSRMESKKTGFFIRYNWILKECKFDLDPREGEVRSPFYPDVYSTAFQCTWTITPPQGSLANVLVVRIRLDEGDFIQITDGVKNVLYSQSTANTNLLQFAPETSIAVNFLSNDVSNQGYFLLKYDTYDRGSCNFTLTTCGWNAIDPLHVWTFSAKESMVIVEEKTKTGYQLPRGYRTQLVSPLLMPSEAMCFRFKYILMGQDAFKMSVHVLETVSEEAKDGYARKSGHKQQLIKVHGAQGNFFLNAAVNFTASNPFHIFITYERGYGPHYKVGIDEIAFSNDFCGAEVQDLASFSCVFHSSFCGWRNTHTDHKNWELGNKGVTVFIDEGQVLLWTKSRPKLHSQFADLLSPPLTLDDLVKQANGEPNLCLSLVYQITSPVAELKLIIRTLNANATGGTFFLGGNEAEREVWGQGRVASPKVLKANIPLVLKSLPPKFEIILRGVSVRSDIGHVNRRDWSLGSGVSVQTVDLESGSCSDGHNCDFEDGFCAWRIISTGNSIWHIQEAHNESFATMLSQGSYGDSSQMVSPALSPNTARRLSFRYLIKDTNQCSQIATMTFAPSYESDGLLTRSLNVIWEQCRGKGSAWLFECLDLPQVSSEYQIIIESGTGPINSQIQIDDIQISEGSCGVSNPQNGSTPEKEDSIAKTSWECRPEGSLCGMTQPLPGSWDWAYHHLAHTDHPLLIHPGMIVDDTEAYHPSSKMMDSNAEYNHYDLDSLSENREDLSSHITLNDKPANPYSHNLDLEFSNQDHLHNPSKISNVPRSLEPFVCPDERALDPAWVCDGVPDCDDKSDEKECDCSEDGCGYTEDFEDAGVTTCGDGSFRCPTGLACFPHSCPEGGSGCLPEHFLCDGHPHCNEREDENSCSHTNGEGFSPLAHGWMNEGPHSSMSSNNRGYYEDYRTMNEAKQATREFEDRVECSGGLFIPKSFVCDGFKDCPLDGLDEVGCFHCGKEEFLCPHSGLCLPKSVVCDGELSIHNCTDERACEQCAPGHFACDACIRSVKVCDGVWDCSEGEDELRCFEPSSHLSSTDSTYSPSGTEHTSFEETTFSDCQAYQFMCPDDRCIPLSSVCDRKRDCMGAEDEHSCQDDNRQEEFFIGASPSNILGLDPWVHFPSYLVTPALQQKEGTISLLSFRYRLDSWIGSSNVTLSIELLNAHDSRISMAPWALWRQTGHKGKLWLDASVIVPELRDVTSFRLGFLLTGKGLEHRSEQIHLSKISFRGVNKEEIRQMGREWSKCEFGDSWCGWSQPYSELGYSWAHASASPHARRTGPITGFPDEASSGFIFTDSLQGRPGDTADLLSPPLQFNEKCRAICFRFAVFLYGAHIAKLSVHVMQVTLEGHSFNAELFHISGGRGQSWIPVSVEVREDTLKEPRVPFLLVVRATRGIGPEADIAFDHVAFTQESCSGSDSDMMDPDVMLAPMTSSSMAYIRTLKAGPSLTPFLQGTAIEQETEREKGSLVKGGMNVTGASDLCSSVDSCFHCVSTFASECVWCGSSNACFGAFSSGARSCPLQLRVHHNSTDEVRAGPTWCPRMAPGQSTTKLIHSETVMAEPFPVTNIPASHTTSAWQCIFTFMMEGEKGVNPNRFQDSSSVNEALRNEIESEVKRKDFSEEEEEEELWKRLKQYAIKKKYRKRVIKVRGQFQGTLFRSSAQDENAAEIGVGAVLCGDLETLIPLPEGVSMARAKVELLNPDGAVLDNPENIGMLVYSCKDIADDCDDCVHLNSSFSCGWCSLSLQCTPHEHCRKGLWHSHNSASTQVCSVQEELNFIKNLLEAEEDDPELGELEEEFLDQDLDFKDTNMENFGTKRKVENAMKKSLANGKGERYDGDKDGEKSKRIKARISFKTGTKLKGGKKKNKKNKSDGKEKSSGKGGSKGSVKLGRKGRGKSFLKVPTQNGIFVARDLWRLHTGRQYYVPVVKKILVNLGFVRHVTYGQLAEEKSRTILMDGAWKKAAGFFIDLYEKAGQDPMTSIITTSKEMFEKMLGQLLPE